MSERRDDTPEANEPSRERGERPRGSYYYDDSTGYEIYDPTKEEIDEDVDGSENQLANQDEKTSIVQKRCLD